MSEDKKPGRPPGSNIITTEIIDTICDRMTEGESLRSICENIGIKRGTFLSFLTKEENKAYFDQYARAQDIRADVLADEILDLADEATDNENTQAQRLKVDTRKWIASKFKPKRYGERIQAEISANGPRGFSVIIVRTIPNPGITEESETLPKIKGNGETNGQTKLIAEK